MNERKEIEQRLKEFQLPSYTEIPDVGLYLDQVTKFINSFLRNYPELEVTPSMISNYVKLKIVSKPVRKVYSRDQIAYFLFIVMAKTVLSMDSIQQVFAIREKMCSVEEGYGYFRNTLLEVLATFASAEGIHRPGEDTVEEIRMLHNVAIAIAHKMYLEQYFRTDTLNPTEEA